MALLYVFFTTVVAVWIGRPLIRLSFRNEASNAAFRYALVRLRDAAEAVGFYRGERAERRTLANRFASIVANYRAFIRRGVAFLGWNLSMNQIIAPLPTGGSGAAAVRQRDQLRRRHPVLECFSFRARLAGVLPFRLRLVRQLPRGDHPARGPGRRQRKGQGTTDFDRAAKYGRRGRARRCRGAFAGWQAAHRSARCAADPG